MQRWIRSLQVPFRQRRAELFISLLGPGPGARVLDLGGADGGFASLLRDRIAVDITVADVIDHTDAVRSRGFAFVRISEGEALPFADLAFDYVLCNSVIEHVTLPKAECRNARLSASEWRRRSLAAQSAFAAEIRRVGRGYFVQTPHRHFPFDFHTFLPFANWLPHDAVRRMTPFIDRYWVKRCDVADWYLLDPATMQALLPDAQIHVERFAGLPKSILAFRRA